MHVEDWLALHMDELKTHKGRWIALHMDKGIIAVHDSLKELISLASERSPDMVPIIGKVGYDGVFEKFS